MIALGSLTVLLVAAILVSAPAAHAASPFYVRLGAGIAAPALEDWNEDIQNDEDLYRSTGAPVDIEKLGVGFPVSVEVGVRLGGRLTLGVLGSYQSRAADQSLSGTLGSIAWDRDVSARMFAGAFDVVLAEPDENGWAGQLLIDRFVFGGDVGWAWTDASYEMHYVYFPDANFNVDVVGDWTGDALTASVWLGVERLLSDAATVFARVGYRHQDFAELQGGYTSPQWGELPGPPRGNLGGGAPLQTDFSGVYVLAGIHFGG